MAKREYIQANKDWLEAKAQEEGVKALPMGIYYKVLAEGNAQSVKPSVRSIVTAHYTGKTINGKTFDRAVAVCRWLADYVTSLKVGLLPCSRCTSVTSGKSISQQKWAMASFHSQASLVVRR